jgi:membrane dipeptidase
MIIVDAHQDLAWNIQSFGRDYTLSASRIRQMEAGAWAAQVNGDTLLGWPEYQRGRVAVVFATLFAAPLRRGAGAWETQVYADFERAHDLYRTQVEAYYDLVEHHPDHFRLIQSQKDLQETLAEWEKIPEPDLPRREDQAAAEPGGVGGSAGAEMEEEARENARAGPGEEQLEQPVEGAPVGLVLLMEGAEGVRSPGELEEWWQRGVRILGPAWAGTRFCGGTREPGPLTKEGYALLEGMAEVGFALDLSHMDEAALLQALDAYPGTILASHSNAAALLKGVDTNRHLSQRALRGILERDGMIGIVPLNQFLVPGWKPRDGREVVGLKLVVAQIDHVCQAAGDARHVGLGTDFDGGYGVQSVPLEVDTIADLRKIGPLLLEKGYSEEDVAAILGQNWLALLRRVLPEVV